MIGVTRPSLNLLVKPRTFSRFSGKKNTCIIYCILQGKMPFKMHQIKLKKNICVPTLLKIFRPVTQNTLIFYLA